jgi:hypothetical protein
VSDLERENTELRSRRQAVTVVKTDDVPADRVTETEAERQREALAQREAAEREAAEREHAERS